MCTHPCLSGCRLAGSPGHGSPTLRSRQSHPPCWCRRWHHRPPQQPPCLHTVAESAIRRLDTSAGLSCAESGQQDTGWSSADACHWPVEVCGNASCLMQSGQARPQQHPAQAHHQCRSHPCLHITTGISHIDLQHAVSSAIGVSSMRFQQTHLWRQRCRAWGCW